MFANLLKAEVNEMTNMLSLFENQSKKKAARDYDGSVQVMCW